MAFLSSMDIVGSGLTAQQLRLDVISENVTNVNTTRTEEGGPYRRKLTVLEAVDGRNSFRAAMAQAQGRASNIGAQGGVRVAQNRRRPVGFQTGLRPHQPGCQRPRLCGHAQCGYGEGDRRRHGGQPGLFGRYYRI